MVLWLVSVVNSLHDNKIKSNPPVQQTRKMLNLLFVLPTQFPAREQKGSNTVYNRERRVNQEIGILTNIISSSPYKINEE